jgi:hypothetical protein
MTIGLGAANATSIGQVWEFIFPGVYPYARSAEQQFLWVT